MRQDLIRIFFQIELDGILYYTKTVADKLQGCLHLESNFSASQSAVQTLEKALQSAKEVKPVEVEMNSLTSAPPPALSEKTLQDWLDKIMEVSSTPSEKAMQDWFNKQDWFSKITAASKASIDEVQVAVTVLSGKLEAIRDQVIK